MNIDGVQDRVAQEAIKELQRKVFALEHRLAAGIAGSLRSGPASQRGSAKAYHPGFYWTVTSTEATLYYTVPKTSTGSYDWEQLDQIAFP